MGEKMNNTQAKNRIEELRKLTEYYANKYYDDDKVEDYDKFELDGYNEAQEFKEEY